MSDSQSLKALADSFGSRLTALEARARATVELAREIRNALPARLAAHVLSASYRADMLVVMVDSGAWCAEIRYSEAVLREHFAARGLRPFTRLKVRVQPPAAPSAPSPHRD